MSALVTAAYCGDVASVRRLLREGASLGESDVNGRAAMLVAVNGGRWTVDRRHTLVVKCLIEDYASGRSEAYCLVIVSYEW
jgi:ankyrin repeat protein